MAVDWEQRVDFDRLRRHRLASTQAALRESDLAALLLLDSNNLRYVTSTLIGEWQRDKNLRFAFVTQDDPPILWDFGTAAKDHQLWAPWQPRRLLARWCVADARGHAGRTGIPDRLAGRDRDHGLAASDARGAQDQERGRDGVPRRGVVLRAAVRPRPRRGPLRVADDRSAAFLRHPIPLEEGMVFALETYCGARDGHSAARIEEMAVCTADGPWWLTPSPPTSCWWPGRSPSAEPTPAWPSALSVAGPRLRHVTWRRAAT